MKSAETSLPKSISQGNGSANNFGRQPIRPPMLRPNGPPPAVAAPKAEEKPKIVEPDYRLWARAHSSDAAVKIMLITSDVVEGKIAGFGLYSVAVETVDGVVVVFKHAMATARERAQ